MTITEIENKIKELQEELEKLNKSDDIFLLSFVEYEKYKSEIPAFNCWWWLRSPGIHSLRAASVYNGGSVDFDGNYVIDGSIAVRPALRFSNIKSKISKSEKGTGWFMYNEVRWKIIDDEVEIAISELPIGFEKFDGESNCYETSYIRKWLLNWNGEQMKEIDYDT